jgi:hypothetical protein
LPIADCRLPIADCRLPNDTSLNIKHHVGKNVAVELLEWKIAKGTKAKR